MDSYFVQHHKELGAFNLKTFKKLTSAPAKIVQQATPVAAVKNFMAKPIQHIVPKIGPIVTAKPTQAAAVAMPRPRVTNLIKSAIRPVAIVKTLTTAKGKKVNPVDIKKLADKIRSEAKPVEQYQTQETAAMAPETTADMAQDYAVTAVATQTVAEQPVIDMTATQEEVPGTSAARNAAPTEESGGGIMDWVKENPVKVGAGLLGLGIIVFAAVKLNKKKPAANEVSGLGLPVNTTRKKAKKNTQKKAQKHSHKGKTMLKVTKIKL